MKIYPIFHILLLEPAATDWLPSQIQPQSLSVIVHDELE